MESLTVSSSLLWTVIAISFLIYLVFSMILVYHWNRYDENSPVIKRVKRIYFSVSVPLVIVSLIASLVFFLS